MGQNEILIIKTTIVKKNKNIYLQLFTTYVCLLHCGRDINMCENLRGVPLQHPPPPQTMSALTRGHMAVCARLLLPAPALCTRANSLVDT